MADKVEKDENVEKGLPIKEKVTMGFSVSGAPIWLCKELSREAKLHYANVYWCVIVDWYRKAKEFENMIRGGLPPPQEELHGNVEEPLVQTETNDKDEGVPLFGGHKGKGK